jgi:hypothetical protein
MWFLTASVGINLSIEILQGIIWFWGWLLVYIRIIHPLTFCHRVNILRENLPIGMIAIVYVLLFYSPGDLKVNAGGVVGKRNRNVVTNDQLPNPCCKRGLVEQQ